MALQPKGVTRASLQEFCEVAPVKHNQGLRGYFNAARVLVVQGESYYADGNLTEAYVYLKRFLSLALKEMPKHKKYTRDTFANDRLWLKRERERVFPILETIAKQLDEADARRERAQATIAAAAAQASRNPSSSGASTTATVGYSLDDLPEVPTGHPSTSKPVGNPGSSAASAAAAAAGPHISAALMPPLYPPTPGLATGMRAPSAPPPPPSSEGNFYNGYGGAGGTAAAVSGPDYGHPYGYGCDFPGGGGGGGSGFVGGMGPGAAVGLGVGGVAALSDAFRSLSVDQGVPTGGHYPSIPQPARQPERPSMERGFRSTERSSFTTERKVVLPSTLVAEFEKIARPNTDLPPYGIETCGILAGRLTHNVLQMTTLIIPEQKGTSDSVETTDETGLFNYMLPNKLITLGWIHTHPKQKCFMSSVDVHTHCGYQLMLPEAVAVVYAPCDNKKRVGVFRLTKPEGMKLIQECELKGFHQHPDNITIYEQADLEWKPAEMSIIDLR